MLILQEWTTNNKFNKPNKTKMTNMNTITTAQKMITMMILIKMRKFIRNNRMRYSKIMKKT